MPRGLVKIPYLLQSHHHLRFIIFCVLLFCIFPFWVFSQKDSTLTIQSIEKSYTSFSQKDSLSHTDSLKRLYFLDELISYYADYDTTKYLHYLNQRQKINESAYVLPLSLEKNIDDFPLPTNKIQVWQDSSEGKFSIEDIIKLSDDNFKPAIFGNSLEVGAYYWIKIKLIGNGKRDERIALHIGSVFQSWSEITLYEPINDGAFRIERSGTNLNPEDKSVRQWRNVFFIDVNKYEQVTIYARLHSDEKRFHPKVIDTSIASAVGVPIGIEEFTYAQGIFQGILWVMAFYNLLLFFIIRDRLYLYYVIMILGIQLNVFYYYRYIYFLFPTSNLGIRSFITLSHWMMIGGGLLFLTRFLNIRELLPKWQQVIRYINILLTICVFIFIIYNLSVKTPTWQDQLRLDRFAVLVIISLGMIGSILGILLGVLVWHKGYLAARYYLIATTAFLLGGLAYALAYIFNIEDNSITYLFQTGVVLQLVFYALGIGYQVNRLEREKSDALAENLELQKETTALLERKVKQRTVEIEQQKEEIEAINHSLVEQKTLIEKRNSDITSSINYARRIQDAVLPDLRTLKREVPQCFVLYKPRDIVSGDFYWFAQKNEKIILAAADCTGHGVPGAFMSILGDSYLNQIVNLQGITDASSILSRLHGQIRRALRQSSTENKDGMDISVCVIDKSENTVTFAGAKRPLLYIQNDTIFEIKGDKHSVGGYQTEAENTYTEHEIKITQDTSFYIFSDGYVDQFGGEHGRKFMLRNFKDLLLQIHKEPMARQRQFLGKHFDDWKGKNKQIDDVLVVGFEITT